MTLPVHHDITHCSFMATKTLCHNFLLINNITQLKTIPQDAEIIGEGSNTLFTSSTIPSLAKIALLGKQHLGIVNDKHIIRLSAGENWHNSIEWCLSHNYCGLENLALIPGSVGAAPVQNIGAYGREIADFIEQVEYFDRETSQFKLLSKEQCTFAYRNSLFKTQQAKNWIITSVTIALPVQWQAHVQYQGLKDLKNSTAQQIFDAVIQLRQSKLPDPGTTPNLGSFFKNPLIGSKLFKILQQCNPEIPHWNSGDKIKLSAAWLIDQCGFKGVCENGAGVSQNHALVLVNCGNATGKNIIQLANKIQHEVFEKYQVQLEIEPRVL